MKADPKKYAKLLETAAEVECQSEMKFKNSIGLDQDTFDNTINVQSQNPKFVQDLQVVCMPDREVTTILSKDQFKECYKDYFRFMIEQHQSAQQIQHLVTDEKKAQKCMMIITFQVGDKLHEKWGIDEEDLQIMLVRNNWMMDPEIYSLMMSLEQGMMGSMEGGGGPYMG